MKYHEHGGYKTKKEEEKMSEKDKTKFKKFCREILPSLENLSGILEEYYPATGIEIYFDTGGYISFFCKEAGWRFRRLDSQSEPEVRLEIAESLFSEKTEKEIADKKEGGRE